MDYTNPKFNAHHDSKAICEEKIRMAKEKIELFRKEGIELDDDKLERALGRSARSVCEMAEDEDADEDEG